MRFRKGRGKVKDRISLTENEIVEACYRYVKDKGYNLGDISYLVIPNTGTKLDSLGRKMKRGIEFRVDIES
jgi:hypothetical protein